MKNKNQLTSITQWIGTKTSLIAHTIFFVSMFSLRLFVVSSPDILLILTTIVSLEAIYLSIFIQMSVNEGNKHIVSVKETVDEVQTTMEDVQETVEDVQETMEDVQETVEDVQETIDDEK